MRTPTCRIRYCENWNDRGEYFVFEIKSSDGTYSLDCAFKLWDYNDGETEEGACMVHYTALTKIREWQKMGMTFYFC